MDTRAIERTPREPDGSVAYSYVQGDLVAILPLNCRRGEHCLTGQYTTYERDGVLSIRCAACAHAQQPLDTWLLRTGGKRPSRAGLDNAPYAELLATAYPVELRAWIRRELHRQEHNGEPF